MKRILTAIAALALVATTAVPAFAGMLDDIRGHGVYDLSTLSVALRELRSLAGAG